MSKRKVKRARRVAGDEKRAIRGRETEREREREMGCCTSNHS